LKQIKPFLEVRRFDIIRESSSTAKEVAMKAIQLDKDLAGVDKWAQMRSFEPFKKLTFKKLEQTMGLGLPTIDEVSYGLKYSEFGIMIGYSGTGKTALAVFSAVRRAMQGTKVLYFSIEEPGENLNNRAYAHIFKLPYTELHKGNFAVQEELKQAMEFADPKLIEALGDNFRLKDLSMAAPIRVDTLRDAIEEEYQATGWYPDLVYIDQMDFLEAANPVDDRWQNYESLSNEVQQMARQHKTGGEHPIAVWLVHQATGKMRRTFSNNEISGFKGILKPADYMIGIGKDAPTDKIVNIFSLKVRHGAAFAKDYRAELEFMCFEPYDKAADERINTAIKERKRKAAAGADGLFANIPGREKVGNLPEADGWETKKKGKKK